MSGFGRLLLATLPLVGCVDRATAFTVPSEFTGSPPLPGLLELLAAVPDGTSWADLSDDDRGSIEEWAARIHDVRRAEWGDAGLRDKEVAVLVSSGDLRPNIERYVGARYGRPGFVLASVDPELAIALRRLYLAHLGGARLQLAREGVLALDWDGVSAFTAPTLPDAQTLADAQAYAAEVLAELQDLIARDGLSPDDAALAQEAVFVARSLRDGSYTMTGLGADELASAGAMGLWGPEPALDRALLGVLSDAEDYLRVQSAMLLGDVPPRLSANTLAALRDYTGPRLTPLSQWADEPEVGRGADLLWGWYLERLAALPAAADRCVPYAAADLERQVDALLADLHLAGDPLTWLADFEASLAVEGAARAGAYHQAAIAGVDELFDDAALPPDARAAVHAAILGEPAFGAVVAVTEAALTAQTGSSAAADAFEAALDGVEAVGGDPSAVDPADAARVAAVWADVRAELVARYSGPSRVVDIDATLPATVAVDGGLAVGTGPTGEITVGLGASGPVALLYRALAGEALRALRIRAGLDPVGIAGDGAMGLAEREVGGDVLAAHAPAGALPFWQLAAVAADARRFGITDATLAVLQTDCAGGADSAELAVEVAAGWGMSGDALTEVAPRAHFGTEFLTYLAGEFAYRDVVASFEAAVGPGVDDGLDAFDLATCGLVNAPLTDAAVAALADCLGG